MFNSLLDHDTLYYALKSLYEVAVMFKEDIHIIL